MKRVMKMSAQRTIAVIAVAAGLSLSPAAFGEQGTQSRPMPVAEQNVLVQRHCAVCHDDAHMNGGLSLQHFDAAGVEPSLAAMMVSKLNSGAIGAAGLPLPEKAAQDALLNALKAKSTGADAWSLSRTKEPATGASLVTASVVREGPSAPELYRLKLTCSPNSGKAEMQVSWAPNPATSGRSISAVADGGSPVTYPLEGVETMGNGAKKSDGTDVTSGLAAAILYATHPSSASAPNLAKPLPDATLAISNIFGNETVVFPFEGLTQTMRRELSACFAANK